MDEQPSRQPPTVCLHNWRWCVTSHEADGSESHVFECTHCRREVVAHDPAKP